MEVVNVVVGIVPVQTIPHRARCIQTQRQMAAATAAEPRLDRNADMSNQWGYAMLLPVWPHAERLYRGAKYSALPLDAICWRPPVVLDVRSRALTPVEQAV
jgi:hypothetical protein